MVDGVARVGLEPSEHERLLAGSRKVAARDLPVAVAQGWSFGATTVSASLALAAKVGVGVFATGGIGGVHRGAEATGDVSADLGALATHPIVTVSAGAKAFLDLARTLEHLEMLGVPVLGFGTDELPAFWMRSSGLPLAHRVDTASEAAAVATAAWELGYEGGVLVTVPIPEADALPSELIVDALATAEREATRAGDHRSGSDAVRAGAVSQTRPKVGASPRTSRSQSTTWGSPRRSRSRSQTCSDQRRRRKPFHRLSSSSRP